MRLPGRDREESIRQRLRNRLRARGEDVQFGLQRYAVERFLYRLGESKHRDRFILKGASLFALWGGGVYRATRDLDFTGYGGSDQAGVMAAIREVCRVSSVSDALIFDGASLQAEPIRDESGYEGLRVRLEATLGKSHIPLQIDIGFGNAIEPPPQDVEYPTLLDDPPPRIRAYPPEAVVAEKHHAMVVLGERNSRFKDFYDLFVLARQFPFDGTHLGRAIAATFDRRRTPIDASLPVALTARFYADSGRAAQWRAYLERNALPGAPGDFAAVGEALQAFLGAPWRALGARTPFLQSWEAGGPWRAAKAEAGSPRRLKAYPAYRDCGVDWLGEIPEHWEAKRLKYVAALNPESLPEDTDPAREMVYVDIGGVDSLGRIVEREHLTFATAPSRARRIVREGDVIVSTVRTYLRAIAPVKEPELGMVVSTGFAVVRPEDGLTPAYAAYALRAPYFVDRVVANSKGVSFPAINESEMGTYEIATPPVSEQRAIAAFLDGRTARIDALVARNERLIELLEERRTTLVTRAVTKGLDLDVPMKDSGVEWLGEIPAHWVLTPLKWLLRRSDYGISDSLAGYGDVRVLTMAHIQKGEVVLPEEGSISDVEDRLLLEHNDLLFNRTNSRELVGKVGLFRGSSEDRVTFASHLVRLTARDGVVPGWLNYLLNSAGLLSLARSMALLSVNQANLNPTKYAQIAVPLPAMSEQHAIADFLDRETAQIDALVAVVREAIGRLRELRTALISAAVIGKIDVREEDT